MTEPERNLAQEVQALLDDYEREGWITTGFVLITTAVHPENDLDGTQGYGYTSAPSQPIHATRGLIQMGADYFARPVLDGDA